MTNPIPSGLLDLDIPPTPHVGPHASRAGKKNACNDYRAGILPVGHKSAFICGFTSEPASAYPSRVPRDPIPLLHHATAS